MQKQLYTRAYVERVVQAQANMGAAIEDSTGQTRAATYRYADLSQVIRATKQAYLDAGLYIRSEVDIDLDSKTVTATTVITDGTTTEYACPIRIPIMGPILQGGARGEPDEKSYGSIVTYARRYSWAAATGVELADDADSVDQRTGYEQQAHPLPRQRPSQPSSTESNAKPPSEPKKPLESAPVPSQNWMRFNAWLEEQSRGLVSVAEVILVEPTEQNVTEFMKEKNFASYSVFCQFLLDEWAAPPANGQQSMEVGGNQSGH